LHGRFADEPQNLAALNAQVYAIHGLDDAGNARSRESTADREMGFDALQLENGIGH